MCRSAPADFCIVRSSHWHYVLHCLCFQRRYIISSPRLRKPHVVKPCTITTASNEKGFGWGRTGKVKTSPSRPTPPRAPPAPLPRAMIQWVDACATQPAPADPASPLCHHCQQEAAKEE